MAVAANLLLVLLLVCYLLRKNNFRFSNKILELTGRFGIKLLMVVTLIATLGSLTYSEIIGYRPCTLCWYQRILMYPQVILLGTALVKKSKAIVSYLMPLSVIGAVIAIYHYIEQIKTTLAPNDPLTPCGSEAIPCGISYTFHFGYITIPMMALSAFLLIIIVSLILRSKRI
jgi:disulfide bond formation protein DsbB